MTDEPRDLSVRVPLDRSALERVLARAAELQAADGEGDEPGVSDAQLIEIAKEVGLSPVSLQQAIAEERSRSDAPAARTALDAVFGGALASASRTVRGTPEAVLAALDLMMRTEEELRVKRHVRDRMLWERAPGIVANLSRAFDLSGRGYYLARADDVAATVVAVDAERTLVRLDASLHGVRAQHLGGGAALVAIGAVGSGVLFALGALPMLTALPVVVFTGIAWATARLHRQPRQRAQVALEQVLDRVERNEKPRPSLLTSFVPPRLR